MDSQTEPTPADELPTELVELVEDQVSDGWDALAVRAFCANTRWRAWKWGAAAYATQLLGKLRPKALAG